MNVLRGLSANNAMDLEADCTNTIFQITMHKDHDILHIPSRLDPVESSLEHHAE